MYEAKITGLNIFPVKSLQGIRLTSAKVTQHGLMWDRFWMVVDQDGRFVSQRNIDTMATISTAITDTHLVLSHDSVEDCLVPLAAELSENVDVLVWSSECQALSEEQYVSEWLTNVLGTFRGGALRLVRMSPEFDRAVSQNHTEQSAVTYFADGYPILVANTTSLDALNNQLAKDGAQAVDMSRFRANLETEMPEPWLEHQQSKLEFSTGQQLHLCKPCERCKVITIDQNCGKITEKGQPSKTLMAMDHVPEKGAYFGQNAVIINNHNKNNDFVISVGDKVKLYN